MKKYKLIKEYPGSPDLGTEVEKESNSKSSSSYFYRSGDKRICVFNDHVEYNPEYWEEVNDIYYMVSLTDMPFHNSWEPIRVETMPFDTDNRRYFETKKQAEEFILYNKPCLSYKDVSFISRFNVKSKEDVLLLEFSPSKLIELVKEKI
jgi:hypothetical protein